MIIWLQRETLARETLQGFDELILNGTNPL